MAIAAWIVAFGTHAADTAGFRVQGSQFEFKVQGRERGQFHRADYSRGDNFIRPFILGVPI